MLFKLVLGSQIRVLDCKETLTLQLLHSFVKKTFPQLKNYLFFYIDEDGDQIIMESKQDINVYLQSHPKKPKIHLRKIQSEYQPFQNASQIIQTFSESYQCQKIEKVQQINVNLPKVQDNNSKQVPAEIEQIKKEQKVEQKEEKNDYTVHNFTCKECGTNPITNIRYKCGVCQDYNICWRCQEKTQHKNSHPFIKIRDPLSSPLKAEVQIEEEPEQKKQVPLKHELKKQEQQEQIKYENIFVRQQLIISYLSYNLGEQFYDTYVQFAAVSTDRTFNKLLESYLAWMEKRNEPSAFAKAYNFVKQKATTLITAGIHKIGFHSD